MADQDSIWCYFSKIENGFVKCNYCSFAQKANPTGSTSNYVRHLENKHKDHYATRNRAIEKKRMAKERAVASVPKITCFTQSCSDLSSLEASHSGGIKRSRKYIIATILDPNYKLKYFDRDQRDVYKIWLIEELCKDISIEPQHRRSPSPKEVVGTGGISDILQEFEQDYSDNESLWEANIPVDQREAITAEVNRYLEKATEKIDSFAYWTFNANALPHLYQLFIVFNASPLGSEESERLFSTAGAIMTDLRSRLSPQNFEKLLFIHHNLPLISRI